MKSPHAAAHRPIAEMIRGVQIVMTSLRSAILLISTPPVSWRPEKASSLGGVIVVPQDVTEEDLEILRNRNLPYLLFTECDLPGPRVSLGQRQAAHRMTKELLGLGHKRFAVLSGFDPMLDAVKRTGIHDALREAGIDLAQVTEISANDGESGVFQASRDILNLNPRPTAVISTDDSLGLIVSYQARRHYNLQVPGDISVVGFHDWPYVTHLEPVLTTVHFDFLTAGQRAAEILTVAALTGEAVQDIDFEPVYRPGQTIGPAPN